MALVIFIAIVVAVTLIYKRFSEGWKNNNPGQPVFRWKTSEEIAKQEPISRVPNARSDGLINNYGGGIDATNNGGTYS